MARSGCVKPAAERAGVCVDTVVKVSKAYADRGGDVRKYRQTQEAPDPAGRSQSHRRHRGPPDRTRLHQTTRRPCQVESEAAGEACGAHRGNPATGPLEHRPGLKKTKLRSSPERVLGDPADRERRIRRPHDHERPAGTKPAGRFHTRTIVKPSDGPIAKQRNGQQLAGWEVSGHPEWEMMYAAGLTVREIADRCRQKRNTVHLHLHVREQYQPGLRATHEAALAARDSDSPTTTATRSSDPCTPGSASNDAPTTEGISPLRKLSYWAASPGGRPPVGNKNSTNTGSPGSPNSSTTLQPPGSCPDTKITKPGTNTLWVFGSTSRTKKGQRTRSNHGGEALNTAHLGWRSRT